MRTTCLTIVCLASLFIGCADQSMDRDGLELSTLALTEGTPKAIGLLTFLNDPSTTMDVLDHEVPLNRRSARNLIVHRDGDDGLAGTGDDDLFETVAEVDAVRWVGPSAMNRLTWFAQTEGWVPTDDDILGTWDGVSFSVADAEATLNLVNKASHDLLDDALALDRRAADSIVAAQPVASIATLARLYYVGGSALTRLKAAALAPVVEPEVTAFQDQFNHDEVEEIPDGSPAGIDTDVHVHGVPDITVYVVLVAGFLHDAPGELQLELTSPSGETWLFDAGDGEIREPLGWMDENPEGVWTLNTVDTQDGNVGEVWGWALEIGTTEPAN